MPGFFDTFQDAGGASYIGKEEKATLIADSTPFPVKRVFYQATGKFGARYVLITELDGEERALSFGAESVESRDRMLAALIEYLSDEDAETPSVIMKRVNQSIILVDPEATEAE